MYTFSQSADKRMITTAEGLTILVERNEEKLFDTSKASKLLAAGTTDFPGIKNLGDGKYEATCDECGWHRIYEGMEDPAKAAAGLRSHKSGVGCKPKDSPNGRLKVSPVDGNTEMRPPEKSTISPQ
jgi:hypothetical protein